MLQDTYIPPPPSSLMQMTFPLRNIFLNFNIRVRYARAASSAQRLKTLAFLKLKLEDLRAPKYMKFVGNIGRAAHRSMKADSGNIDNITQMRHIINNYKYNACIQAIYQASRICKQ